MWSTLALQDIKLRYRGSMLGPFWLTISMFITVLAMGVIYPLLFRMSASSYVPYLALGLIVWQLLSSIITESCDIFLREEGTIQQVPLPFSIYAYRSVCRNFMVLAHNLILLPIGVLFFGVRIGWNILEVIPAFLLLAVNGFWITILLGLVSARFRDVPPIVSSFLQVLFFLTPVIWPVAALGELQRIVMWNPLFAAIDVVRSPLLGVTPAESSWFILIGTTVLGSGLAFVTFARFRARIAYWI
jgi:ABC-type polysaccharide/polyol phosphate export permease